jgi:hypothetical protein
MSLRRDKPKLFDHEDQTAPDMMGALTKISHSWNTVRLLFWASLIVIIIHFVLR